MAVTFIFYSSLLQRMDSSVGNASMMMLVVDD